MNMPEMPAPMMIASKSVLLAVRGRSVIASESFIRKVLGRRVGRIGYWAVSHTRSAEVATRAGDYMNFSRPGIH